MNEAILTVILTVVGTGATVFGLIYAFLRNFKADVDTRFEKIETRFEKHFEKMDTRLEGWMRHSIAIQAEQSKRMDQLYQMFIDLLKEKK